MSHDHKISVPPGVDLSKPSVGRMYDYYLRGQVWTEVDRQAAERIREMFPEIHDLAVANRSFLERAAAAIARAGVDQFLDLGSGLPTQWNTHEVVHLVNPHARVVYVDSDPMIVAHARHLLEERGEAEHVRYLEADACDPDSILRHPQVTSFLDLDRPIGHMQVALWHFVGPENDPHALVRRYLDASVSGSYLALSHVTPEGLAPERVEKFLEVYAKATAQLQLRTVEEIGRFFDGLEYLPPYEGAEPGLSFVGVWGARPGARPHPVHTLGPCGVARKP